MKTRVHERLNRQMEVYLRQHASKRVDLLIFARVVIPEVELRMPISRLVLGDTARGAVARLQLIEERGYTKSYSDELDEFPSNKSMWEYYSYI